MKHLSSADRLLYQAVDEVLHYVWDPIGVSDIPQARDEYHAYLPQVFSLVRDGREVNVIAQYLTAMARQQMGFDESAEHDRMVAELLLEWKDWLDARSS
jgi:hypothetical protein